jgi:L-fuconolactonase
MSSAPQAVFTHAELNPAWLNKLREDILEPNLPIIDPHHHLWDRGGGYFFEELLADTGSGHNIVATVFVQCGYGYRTSGLEQLRSVGETEFVAGVAAEAECRKLKTLVCAGIVGTTDLTLGEGVDTVLRAHVDAGRDRFRGIHHITARTKISTRACSRRRHCT